MHLLQKEFKLKYPYNMGRHKHIKLRGKIMQNLNDGQSGGEASHTARLAYLKAEDAHRRLDEAERIAARTFAPPLYAGLYTRTVFSGGISLPELELTCPADTAAHIEVRLVIDSPAAGRFTVTPVLGGARAEEGEGALQAGFSSHSFAFVLPLKKGAHTLGFDISAPAGSYALESAAVCITAKVSAEKEKAVQNFFSGMSAQDAVAMLLTDARLREKLGSSYIYLLNHYRSKI